MEVSARELADRQVSILVVCRAVGMEVPEAADYGRSVKTYCPFGPIYHADRGTETAFRIYPEANNAYCFAGCGFYSPTWLYAQANGISPEEAASVLLEMIGYKGDDFERRWAAATSQADTSISHAELAEALKVYCSALVPDWEERQFDPGVADLLGRCLGLLPLVIDSAGVEKWLRVAKVAMAKKLMREGESSGSVN